MTEDPKNREESQKEGAPAEDRASAEQHSGPSEMGRFVAHGIRDTIVGVRIFLLLFLGLGAIGLLVLFLSTGCHTVSPNEVGILERMGRLEGAPLSPGFHFTLPWPFDRVTKVPVKTVHKLTIDGFCPPPEPATGGNPPLGGPSNMKIDPGNYRYILTGDNNIIDLQATVLYTILNPADYLYGIADHAPAGSPEGVRDSESLIRSLCATAMVHTLAEMTVDWALTGGKRAIEEHVRARLQARLEVLRCGIGVTFVELKSVAPPPLVTEYFNDVVKAKIDKRKYINDAESYRNETLTTAEALADERVQSARGYRNERQETARGETQRFLKQLKEYRGAESITRYRLYLDFITSIAPQLSHKVISSRDGKKDVARIRIRIGEKKD